MHNYYKERNKKITSLHEKITPVNLSWGKGKEELITQTKYHHQCQLKGRSQPQAKLGAQNSGIGNRNILTRRMQEKTVGKI